MNMRIHLSDGWFTAPMSALPWGCGVRWLILYPPNRDKNILTTQRLFGAWGKLLTIEQRDIDIYVVKKIIDLYNWEALDTIHISKATENWIVIL